MQWYYTVNGRQEGPVDEETLARFARQGALKPTDFVWNETMGETWQQASEIPGLFGVATPAESAGEVAAESSVRVPEQGPLPGRISCVAPVRRAWRRMAITLFSPFDFAKWFILGFTAWLATLGEGGGGSLGSRGNMGDWEQCKKDLAQSNFNELLEPVREFFARYGGVIVLSVVGVLVVGLAIGLLVVWLRSRGKFMLLDNVVHNRADVTGPWRILAQHGNSLFVWTIVYSIVCLVISALLLAVTAVVAIVPCIRAGEFVKSVLPGLGLCGALWLVFAVAAAYVARFLEDFIVPIMYHFDLTAMEAWGRFLALFKQHRGGFILYGVFYLVLTVAAMLLLLVIVLVTCCIAGCLMAIPYLGAVVMLPFTVFFRAYSVEYLAQFGEEYRIFPERADPDIS